MLLFKGAQKKRFSSDMKGKGRKQHQVGDGNKVIIISFYFGAPILLPPVSFWLLAFYSPISGWEYMAG